MALLLPEPLETPPAVDNYAIFESQFSDIDKFYIAERSNMWEETEIVAELATERLDALPRPALEFIKRILSFFAVSDKVVAETITVGVVDRIPHLMIQNKLRFQAAMEDIHNRTYNLMVNRYFSDPIERHKALNAVANHPTVAAKVNWIREATGVNKIVTSRVPLANLLFANIITEGLFFMSSFAGIFWANHHYRGLVNGLVKGNEFILRDETSHKKSFIYMYIMHVVNKLSEEQARSIMKSAVVVELEFIRDALPGDLSGMNYTLMERYVKHVADTLMTACGYSEIYGEKDPFPFMAKSTTSSRSNDMFAVTHGTQYTTVKEVKQLILDDEWNV